MKIVVISNSLIFHQAHIWDELYKKKDIELKYLSTMPLTEERKKMKYVDEQRDYLFDSLSCSIEELDEIFDGADFVFLGNNYDKRLTKYVVNAPNLIVMAEHLSKRPSLILNALGTFKWIVLEQHYKCKGNKYLLAFSQFAYDDFKNYGFKKTTYRFGYFPSFDEYKNVSLDNKDPFAIVWHGRIIQYKHAECAIELLRYLKLKDVRYHLEFIGEGEDLERQKRIIASYNLTDSVIFSPFLAHDEIMKKLLNASIHVFSSDRQEGWGVVLNEAMAAGCICFASSNAGSSGFLVEDGVNALTFSDDNKNSLYKAADRYLKMNEKQILEMRKHARNAIFDLWDYRVACERLYELLTNIYNQKDFDKYKIGPVSKIIK